MGVDSLILINNYAQGFLVLAAVMLPATLAWFFTTNTLQPKQNDGKGFRSISQNAYLN